MGKSRRKIEKLLVTYDLPKLNQENIKTKTHLKGANISGPGVLLMNFLLYKELFR